MNGYMQVHVWVTPREAEKLRRLAVDRDQTVSALIRTFIRREPEPGTAAADPPTMRPATRNLP